MPSDRWEPPYDTASNVIISNDDYMVSYNPNPCSDMPCFRSDDGGDETAIKRFNPESGYLVLNGDFRDEYEAVFDDGWDALVAVYNKHKEDCASSWTMEK